MGAFYRVLFGTLASVAACTCLGHTGHHKSMCSPVYGACIGPEGGRHPPEPLLEHSLAIADY